ncbi:hypothetical protein M23134_05158 [Microscilla marina ATCC 23134]|uniref:Uncharacterized protein n=1 Tax=Microscilla marina ATCC 23134 TaxID=313606 RepID=A1ZDB3_MICM2|nr:hypothetical protein M23134_05158 [Microscilla marina ATCC 23134]
MLTYNQVIEFKQNCVRSAFAVGALTQIALLLLVLVDQSQQYKKAILKYEQK